MYRFNWECRNFINDDIRCGRWCSSTPCPAVPCPSPSPAPYPCPCACSSAPFRSSYIEAVGSAQTIGVNQNFVFDITPETLDIAGNDIGLDASGTVFTIRRAGLYYVSWSFNSATATAPMVIGLMENGSPSSALANSALIGNHASGALLNISSNEVPFTISLHNFGTPISIANAGAFQNIAASIRIFRFADGPVA